MYCISCGAKLPDDARFCASCGAKVYTVDTDEQPTNRDDSRMSDEVTEDPAAGDADKNSDESEDTEDDREASEDRDDHDGSKGVGKSKGKGWRQGSGALELPEIDPSHPFDPLPYGKGSAKHDEVAVSPDVTVVMAAGPFKPSYGPLSPSDLFSEDGTTAKMPRIATVDGEVLVEGDGVAKNYVQSNTVPKRWTPLRVFLLVVMVAVAVGLAIAAVQLYGERTEGQNAQTTVSQASATSQEESTDDAAGEEQDAVSSEMTEEERLAGIYERLETTYEQIQTLNTRLSQAVDDYNTYYLVSDVTKRQAAAEDCYALANDIQTVSTELGTFLEENDCTVGTAYYDQAQSMQELLDLLAQRAAPLVASWERSVASSSPSADEAYILEPLRETNSTTLVSEFDALNARSAPVEETA